MLSIRSISRSFNGHQALKDVSFDVRDGLMTGFVGANGAGKTTAMRIILGVLSPDSGEVLVDGRPVSADDRAQFGYMPEERGLYPKMKVHEQLVYLGRLHGLASARAAARADDLLEQLGLTERRDDKLESLSLGNQQRAQIAAALVHEPTALVLDEPFSGLDPMAVETTLGVLRDVARTGAPVLFSSHQLDLVERLCDSLVILAHGQVRAAGTREQIRAAHTRPEWLLETDDAGFVRGIPGIEVIDFDGGHVRFAADSDAHADRVLREALERGTVRSFAPSIRPLTEIFQEVVR
ncbi:ATP-binding cassette domain-containing protein [Agrococcus sp. Marseille-Q4369]|uniref:ABC transporter ATP-binding protein n=1 Tax=unclassified Agrococcus TaxID=2615065 RepID=UPI001B8BCD9F|nr:ATP-binding cassette domain-containing protein [Agrococcus sp. Marseille-Q4369]QUW18206.1 ATP-binding cassette domain-containing protein [Agrococcus sp. Marseille-Q4369]